MSPRLMMQAFGLLICSYLPLITATLIHDLAIHIKTVRIIPTAELIRQVHSGVEEKTGEIIAVRSGKTSITLKTKSDDDWLDPKMYSRSLQSVLVHAVSSREGPNICVLMADSRFSLWDDDGKRSMLFEDADSRRHAMWLLPSMINLVHAVRQGYDFAHIQMPSKHLSRHSAWLKLVAMRIILPRYDYVLYLDSDVFFRQPGAPNVIEAMMAESQLGTGKIMAVTKENPIYPDVANTGIVLLRNCEEAPQLLYDWWYSVARHSQYMMYKRTWSFEQGAFTWVVYPAYNESISLLNLKDWNSPEGKNIRHIWSVYSNEERERFFMDASAFMMEQLEGFPNGQGADVLGASAKLVAVVEEVLKHRLDRT